MQTFLMVLKGRKYAYVAVLSLATVIVLLNTFLDFLENVINNHGLIAHAAVIFAILFWIGTHEEVWKE